MAKSMGANPEALKKMEAAMKSNKDKEQPAGSSDKHGSSDKQMKGSKQEKPKGMSAMMAAMGKSDERIQQRRD